MIFSSVSWVSQKNTKGVGSVHCECFPLRKLCSSLALSSRDGSRVSASCGPGAVSAEAEWSLKLWGYQMELAELI